MGLLCAALIIVILPAEAFAESNYNLEKLGAALQTPLPNLVLLTAHRGLWQNVPENSYQSIDAAVAANLEMVEVDVRLSQDGTPWLLHDRLLNRHTTGTGYVELAKDAYLAQLRLRDRHDAITDVRPLRLEEVLDYYSKYVTRKSTNGIWRGYLLVADIKPPADRSLPNSYEALKKCWAILQKVQAGYRLPLGHFVIFKLQANTLPDDPKTIDLDLKSKDYRLVPVLFGDPQNQIKEKTVFNNYFRNPEKQPSIVSAEVYLNVPSKEPLQDWLNVMTSKKYSISGFPAWDEYSEGVAFADGTCCNDRNQNPGVSSPPLDYAGSWEYWIQVGTTWITGDQVVSLQEYLTLLGKRDTSGIM